MSKKIKSLFSRTTYFYSLFVIISASFLREILALTIKLLGQKTIEYSFYLFCLTCIFFLITYLIKKKYALKKYILLFITFILSFILISSLEIFAEKVHVIIYGLLGFLAIKDTKASLGGTLTPLIWAFCFTTLVNISDELFQAILPYRVGEVRDIFINTMCIILGFLYYAGLYKTKN